MKFYGPVHLSVMRYKSLKLGETYPIILKICNNLRNEFSLRGLSHGSSL